MRPFHTFGALGALLLCGTQAIAQDAPKVGDIFEIEWNTVFKGWKNFNTSTSDVGQPFTVFQNGNEFLINGTETIRNDVGKPTIQRIVFQKRIALNVSGERAESGGDCSFLGLEPAIAFFNPKSRIATGFFVVRGEVVTRRWIVDEPELCQYGGE